MIKKISSMRTSKRNNKYTKEDNNNNNNRKFTGRDIYNKNIFAMMMII